MATASSYTVLYNDLDLLCKDLFGLYLGVGRYAFPRRSSDDPSSLVPNYVSICGVVLLALKGFERKVSILSQKNIDGFDAAEPAIFCLLVSGHCNQNGQIHLVENGLCVYCAHLLTQNFTDFI